MELQAPTELRFYKNGQLVAILDVGPWSLEHLWELIRINQSLGRTYQFYQPGPPRFSDYPMISDELH